MVTISNIMTVAACGFILSIAPAGYAQAKTSPSEERTSLKESYHVVKGEVIRLKGDHLYVKGKNGKEVHMHVDQATKMSDKKLEPGDRIEATVNEDNQVLSIHSADRTR